MQVATGDGYQAAAAEQSVRDVVVQPARGLIVDDMGRPLVANRSSWVVSLDRTLLGKLPEDVREKTLRKLAPGGARPGRQDRGTHPAVRAARLQGRHLLERLAVPAGARRARRPAEDRGQGARAVRGLPRGAGPAGERARLPLAVRRQRRAPARLPQPDHRGRARRGRAGRRPVGQRRLGGRPCRRREGVRHAGCAASPATRRSPSTPWAACSATPGRSSRHRGTPWSPRSTRKVQAVVEKQLHAGDQDRARHLRHGHRAQLRRRQRRRGRARRQDRPRRRDGEPADVRPGGLVRRHHREAAEAALLRARPARRCSRAPPRASSRRARRGSRS